VPEEIGKPGRIKLDPKHLSLASGDTGGPKIVLDNIFIIISIY
jgi:hypothetical protein